MESPGTADGSATGHEDEVERRESDTRALHPTEAAHADNTEHDGNERNDDDDHDEDESDGDEEEEDEEPRLKYAYLTRHLPWLYRNGDATSAFLTGGDKMVCYLGGSERVRFGLTGCL